MYDTLHVTAKCVDSNGTLDTVIFYDSLAGAAWVAFDTLFATDSAKGGVYTTKKIDSLKAQGMHYVRAKVIDKYDSMRTSTSIAINVRNRIPSVAISSPAVNTLFKMYDTLHVTAKCVDSNGTLDTVIFYDSLAAGTWRAFDTLFATDSAKGGLYTTKKIDSLKAQGIHYVRAKVIDKYDSMRISTSIAINIRNRIPSVAVSSPAANTLFKMYDTLHVTAKCVDSNSTLDTVIFYDSLAGATWVAFDTLFATDSAKGGLYTTKKIDSLKAQGMHYLRARVIDKYDSMRTSTSVAINVRNRVPSVAISSPAANTLFKMYDTLHVTAKCVDSNSTLDTVIFYDSLAGGAWRAFDTLFATDSAKGGLYTMKKIDSLKAQGTHYLRARVIDKYDSMRTSTSIAISVRNRIPSVAISSPAANTLFKMYDTLHVTAKCVDSNGTLDTVIFYDSLAGATWVAFDTLFATDSAKGGLYTTKKIDSLKTMGMHYLRAKVIDKYDSMRTSTSIAINVRNRIPSVAINSPAANTLFKMYDTLHVTAKCVDSNGTLDTVIFYDSLAGGTWRAFDTLYAADSAKGGLYTTKKIDSLKAVGMHYLRARVIDKYDSMRTSTSIAINVRNRIPSIAISSPAVNTLFKMYDTLHITAKCVDSNGTLDTVIFYDSLAGGAWVAMDTLFATDSAKGGLYTTKKIDSLKALGMHYLRAKVIDKYDSMRTSASIAISVRNRVPSVAITSPLNNTEFKFYDTINVTAKCIDSNGTLDTVIFYDSLAGATWKAFDTLFAADSAKGGLYTTKKYDTLSPGGTHFLKVKVIDKYDSTRTSTFVTVVHHPPTAVVLSPLTDTTSDGCTLTWSLNSDAGFASYKVYYSTSPGVDTSGALYGTITNRNVTSIAFSGSGFTSGTTFYVKIYVFDMAGQFVGSNEGIATTK
jgi:nicotinamide mononucleotide adenylyltransferase